MFNFGAFFGVYPFARCAVTWAGGHVCNGSLSRRWRHVTAFVFKEMPTRQDMFWMVAADGAAGAAFMVFVGYAIYFPELFPTRLAEHRLSFCYNVARYVAAIGPQALVYMKPSTVKPVGHRGLRNAGVAMCVRAIFSGLWP